jgi:tetratricopeptide (TPR) repeat protein
MPRPASKEQTTPPPGRGRYWWLAGLAVVYSGLIYLNALQNPYVYDDNRTVLNNPSIADIKEFKRILLRESMRPLVNLSYALDRVVWPAQPLGHHLTSVLLHMLNVLLFFHLCWVATEDVAGRAPPGPVSRLDPTIVAFVAASIFGLHPMMTEAVGYISGRSEVLYSAFFLSALLACRRWSRGDGRRWLILSIALWTGAVMSKEVAVFWPLVASLYDHYILSSDEGAWRHRFRRVYLPLLLLTVLAGAIRLGILLLVENPGQTGIVWRFAPLEVFISLRYFWLLVVPFGQSIFHEVEDLRSVFDLRVILGTVWLAAWLAVAWRVRRQNPLVAVGLLWYQLLLVPSAILVVLDLGEPMAEHRAYLSAAGLFLAAGAAVGWAWAVVNTRSQQVRIVLRVVLAIYLTVLGGLTVLRNTVWSNRVRLWLDAVEKAPDVWVPHLLLGEALHDAGSFEEALAEYRMAVRLRPEEPVPYMKLGLCLAEMRRLDEAAQTFQELERIQPGSAVARNGQGAVAMLAGRYAEARAHYASALAAHPDDVAARQSLALLAETVDHDPAEALRLCEQVQQIAPETPGNDDCIQRNRAALHAAGTSP